MMSGRHGLQDAVGPLTEAHFNKKQMEVGSTAVFFWNHPFKTLSLSWFMRFYWKWLVAFIFKKLYLDSDMAKKSLQSVESEYPKATHERMELPSSQIWKKYSSWSTFFIYVWMYGWTDVRCMHARMIYKPSSINGGTASDLVSKVDLIWARSTPHPACQSQMKVLGLGFCN